MGNISKSKKEQKYLAFHEHYAKLARETYHKKEKEVRMLIDLSRTQIGLASTILAEAFRDYPLFVRLFPNLSKRKKVLPYFFDFMVRHGFLYGKVYTTSGNLEGVAIWFHSEKAELNLWRLLRVGVSPACFLNLGKGFWELLRYDKYVSELRQHHVPFRHWYLNMLAVAPEFQGKGYASALMRPMLAQVEQDRLPCYLETQEEENVGFYEYHGFSVVQKTTIPHIGIPNWSMMRR